jgi:ADP-heptose:LPS heptosyltransferase
MRALDLVISVDSMPAHLAGALGVPAWTLLHHEPDWRWMTRGDGSAWYPKMWLFRQTRPGDWVPVIERVAIALAHAARIERLHPRAHARDHSFHHAS